MSQLVILVINDPGKVDDLIEVWARTGVAGLTLFDSSGLSQHEHGRLLRDDLPLFPSLRALMRSEETASRTLFSVVPDDFDVDRLIEAAESVLGSLDGEHSGILFVVPVTRVVGLKDRGGSRDQ